MDLEHLKAAPLLGPAKQAGRTRTLAALGIMMTLAPALSGCGVTPFIDGRREAGQTTTVGPSNPDRVAVCYSSQGATPSDVLATAQKECAKTNRTAVFDGQDEFQCALLAPTRAYFKCVAK